MTNIPEEPGAYFDKGGDVWIRLHNGVWVDHLGEAPVAMGTEEKTLLSTVGPFTPVPRAIKIKKVYRVKNKKDAYESTDFLLIEEARLDAEVAGDVVQTRIRLSTAWEEVEDDSAANN